MTDNYYVYTVDLPNDVTEMVCPCLDGYTIYINARLDRGTQHRGLLHAIHHITHNDFEKADIQSIEFEAHRRITK